MSQDKKFSTEESLLLENLLRIIEEDDRRLREIKEKLVEKPIFKN